MQIESGAPTLSTYFRASTSAPMRLAAASVPAHAASGVCRFGWPADLPEAPLPARQRREDRVTASPHADAKADVVGCRDKQQYTCEVGLRPGPGYVHDRFVLMGFMTYVDACSHVPMHVQNDLAAQWWSRFRHLSLAQASASLGEINKRMTQLFYLTAPAQRAGKWNSLSQAVRIDLNIVMALSRAVLKPPDADSAGACPPAGTRHAMTYRDMADALDAARQSGGELVDPDAGYLLALSFALRTHHEAIVRWLRHQVDADPLDAKAFVDASFSEPHDLPAHSFERQRRQDLIALLFFMARHRATCALEPEPAPSLEDMRQIYLKALADRPFEMALVARLFEPTGRESDIVHTGLTLRHAKGMDAQALSQAMLRVHPEMARLTPSRQLAVVRIKLVALDESPDQPVGHVLQAMATTLMRMSHAPPGMRYTRYATPLDMLVAWEQRHQQWLTTRDFPFSPELYGSIHAAHANGVQLSSLAWYRSLWEQNILAPLQAHPAIRSAPAAEQAALWQWVENRLVHWSAHTRQWRTITPQTYAEAVMRMADTLYTLKQPDHQPRAVHYVLVYSIGGSDETTWRFSHLLDGLSVDIKHAVSQVARQFDTAPLYQERLLYDSWLGASFRVLDYAHHMAMAQFQPPPSFSVEVQAYFALQDAGLSHDDVFSAQAFIVNTMSPPEERPTVGFAYDKFLAVVRSPRRDDLLILSNGQRLYPHHLIDQAFDDYLENLPRHQWIVGRARQRLRDRGLPLLPSLLNEEIERLAGPFRARASKATQLGTRMADEWFGNLPISYPILKMGRAVRDGKFKDLPYYLFVLGRDVLATAALVKGITAAYVAPALMTAGRIGGAVTLTADSLPRAPRGRSMRGWGDDGGRSAKPGKPREVNLMSDQTSDMQTKVIRSRTRANAAHHLSRSQVEGDERTASAQRSARFHKDQWETLRRQLLPGSEEDAVRQQSVLFKLNDAVSRAIFDFAQEGVELSGDARLLGLSGIGLTSQMGGRALFECATVAQAYQFGLIVIDSASQEATPLERHIRIEGDEALAASPDAQADRVLAILQQAYRSSTMFRSLFHAYDASALETSGLCLRMDKSTLFPRVIRTDGAFRALLHLPEPTTLPVVLSEGGFVALGFRQAVIGIVLEAMMAALTPALRPVDPARERGAAVWWTNMVMLELGDAFLPRVNAAYYGPDGSSLNAEGSERLVEPVRAAIARRAEWEDQLLERLQAFDPLAGARHRFQDQWVATRPTVAGVVALLTRLDYRQRRLDYPAKTVLPAAPGEAWALLARRVSFASEALTPQVERLREQVTQYFAKSVLFRVLLTHACAPEICLIAPASEHDASRDTPETPTLNGSAWLSTALEPRRYLGLAGMAAGHAEGADPVGPLHVLHEDDALFQRVVAALIDVPADVSPSWGLQHRGTTLWVTDLIFLQAGRRSHKRLAAACAAASDSITATLLDAYAASNRRWARIEDNFIWHWMDQVPDPSA